MAENKKISIQEVEHIAELARIELSKEEKEKFSRELSDVIKYIDQLKEVDTDNIEPVSQVAGMVNVVRGDDAEKSDEETRKGIIENFPEEEDGYIKVKQVL